jgi:hypothetical protein
LKSGDNAFHRNSAPADAEPDETETVDRVSKGPDLSVNEPPAALDALCCAFSLSRFERDLLLLCAGVELDSAFGPLCAAAQGDPARNFPTFSLALAALPEAHWSALTPAAPLRRWRLIELGSVPALTSAPLRIDERVLHYLAGVPHLDERLTPMIETVPAPSGSDLPGCHRAIVNNIVAAWSSPHGGWRVPVIQLCATDPCDCRPIAAAAAASVHLRAVVLQADSIPAAPADFESVLRLWEREAAFGTGVLLLECDFDGTLSADDQRTRTVMRFVERLAAPVLIATREPFRMPHRPVVNFNVTRPSNAEQRAAWRAALPTSTGECIAGVDAIASQFNMSLSAIRAAAAQSVARARDSGTVDIGPAAWEICRARCRTRLEGLAQRIEPVAAWDDLVLPESQLTTLRQITMQVRHRSTVYESWKFAVKSSRGLGISALFCGPSGTGKTMAAEVLATELRLDLYRIDLASVVSKYIGETEKNLRRVFDAAEEGGAILLFDEADALFGKRSEVKDSHDRYANIEVSYLLQRMEAYRGLAILTTNLKSALDSAFLRRLRFIVQFPFPGPAERAEIWRHTFPKDTPTDGIDFTKLARLNITGGNIRNIAMNAAFLAADASEPVRMKHLLEASRGEYAKLEKALTEAEIGGWVA